MIRRRAMLAGLAAPMVVRPAFAAGLNLIVGAEVGTATDLLARAFAPFLERHLVHGRVAVRNRPGAGGLVGYRTLAGASAEGGNLGWVATPALTVRSIDLPEGAGLLDRLLLIGTVQRERICLVTLPSSSALSGSALLERAAIGGGGVPLGTPPSGSPGHLAALRLQGAIGQELRIVAFPSAAACLQAALSGTVSASVLGQSDIAASLRAGRLIGFALAADGEIPAGIGALPVGLGDVGLPVSLGIQRGLAAPLGLSAVQSRVIAEALAVIAGDADFAAQGEAMGFQPLYQSGAAWAAQARVQQEKLERIWQKTPWAPPPV